MRSVTVLAATILLGTTALAASAATGLGFDPVRADPTANPAHPPRTATTKITSGDAKLNTLMYLAGGAGTHPVVILLHGYPGNEKNLDLAQAIRRAGFHVVWFNYRGSWGSGGTFSLAHALEDTRQAIAFARSREAADKYGFDANRVAVLGHSFGGWLAFMLGAEDAKLAAIGGLAAWNAVIDVITTESDAKRRTAKITDLDFFDDASGPLRGNTAAGVYAEIAANRINYDYFRKAAALSTRPLLVLAATRDEEQPLPEYHDPLVAALRRERAQQLEVVLYDDDHVFSAHRVALAETVTRWLKKALLQSAQ